MENAIAVDDRLDRARALVTALETGDEIKANLVIKSFSAPADHDLFHEVGRLTRELHDAIVGFATDREVTRVVQHEIPDAAERLKYVIELTENAANQTLEAVEFSIPVSEELASVAKKLAAEWDCFCERKMELTDFRALSAEIGDFLALASNHSEILNKKLTEILLAQGYQDLTGQVIRRVINLISDMEEKLVKLVAISGDARQREVDKSQCDMEGPAIPNIEQGEMIGNQNDVDDLLSSLGF
ncbi:Chemotaxis response - phosphatase CheZ [hydrothermal vent metagenome]|uniref:Protein phosphatase CheZ n=1 Tax=hydrothermal vent metagenome TaxID=652676 RepID=A0A3B1B3Z4_9ZZZZ